MKFEIVTRMMTLLTAALMVGGCGSSHGNNTQQMGGAIQGKNLSLNGAVSTVAGTPGSQGSVDGTGAQAKFNNPQGITSDGHNLYVADSGNNTIRKINISTGAVTTIAGTAGSSGSVDGLGTAARFSNPKGITTDGTNLYIADTNNGTIRKIVIATGAVTTIAGTAGVPGEGGGAINVVDGTGAAATFYLPGALTTDGTNLYVVDALSMIRKVVIASGEVTTLAGSVISGSNDGTGLAASFDFPSGITTDGINLYIADTFNLTIRKLAISTRVVTTIAGTAGSSGPVDGLGSSARFWNPLGITMDGANIFITERCEIIRKMTSAGEVTILAGSPGVVGSADASGTAASFSAPYAITTDGFSLFVADTLNNTIRRIN